MASYRLTALVSVVIALLCINPVFSFVPGSKAQDLKQYNDLLGSRDNVLVFFHDGLNGRTQTVIPKFREMLDKYAAKDLLVIIVNAKESPDLAKGLFVTEYPTIRAYRRKFQISQVVGDNLTSLATIFAAITN